MAESRTAKNSRLTRGIGTLSLGSEVLMAFRETRAWRRLLALTSVGLVLMLIPACAVNRHLVRVHTQLRLMNDDLASRQQKMDRDFELMTQLMQQNAAALETATGKVESMRQAVAESHARQKAATMARQAQHLQGAAQEVDHMMTDIEARTKATNELLLRTLYPSRDGASQENNEGNSDKATESPKL
jgi:hypothetical protein